MNGRRNMNITAQQQPAIWARFRALCHDSGVTINLGLERVIIDAINTNRIPGIERLELDPAGFKETKQLPEMVPDKTLPRKGQQPSKTVQSKELTKPSKPS